MSQYELDYGNDGHGQQVNLPPSPAPKTDIAQPTSLHGAVPPTSPRFEMPASFKTILTVCACFAAFIAVEKYAPKEFKISYLMGSYNRELAEAEKEGELNAQAKFEDWAIQTKYTYDQNLEQYKAVSQGILRYYDGTYQLSNTALSGYIQMHQQYKGVLYTHTQQTQAADMGFSNLATIIGRTLNLAEPGLGDGALDYASDLNSGMRSQLRSTSAEDFPLQMKEWHEMLPSPAQVRLELESITLATPPPLPQIGEDAYTKKAE